MFPHTNYLPAAFPQGGICAAVAGLVARDLVAPELRVGFRPGLWAVYAFDQIVDTLNARHRAPSGIADFKSNLNPWADSREQQVSKVERKLVSLAREVWLQSPDSPKLLDELAHRAGTNFSASSAAVLAGLYLSLAHASCGDKRNEWLAFFRSQVGLAWGQFNKNASIVRDCIEEVSLFFRNGYIRAGSKVSIEPEFVRVALVGLDRYWIEIGHASNPNIRASVAVLLRDLATKAELAPELKKLLNALTLDSRARVRKAATVLTDPA